MTKTEEHQKSFARWQDKTNTQFGYVINLLLAFATASLGFGFSFVKENSFHPNSLIRVDFGLSLLLLLVSVIFGLLCAANRLKDFRETAAVARERENDSSELAERRKAVKALGKRTWSLFHGQLWCFVAGTGLLFLALAAAYWSKV